MAQFTFQPPPHDFAGSIAELMLRGPDALANAQLRIGQAQAQAAQQSGQAWGGAIDSIGNIVGNIPQQIQQQKANEQRLALGQTQLDEAQRRAQQAAEEQRARTVVNNAARAQTDPSMQPTGPTQAPENSTLPETPKIVTDTGLFDVPAITKLLAEHGLIGNSEKLIAGLDSHNTALEKFTEAQQAAATAKNNVYARAASGILDAQDAGVPWDLSSKIFAQSLISRGLPQSEVASAIKQLNDLPSDEARTAALKDMVSRFQGKETVVGRGAKVVVRGPDGKEDPSKTITNPIPVTPPRPTEASLAMDANDPTSPTSAQSRAALDELGKRKNPPSLEEQYLKAIADGKKDTAKLILDTWRAKADASGDPVARAQLEAIRNLNAQEARARLDEKDTGSEKNQQKFEQQYRTVLSRAMSSRSGGIGLEDGKVQQANHLTALMDQYFDPKTGDYSVPPAQYSELALGLARLLSPGGTVGIQLEQEIKQASLKGDFAKMMTYATGTPVTGSTQAIFKQLRDSIDRQGQVAETNREGEMRYLRGLAPTDLNEDRRLKLEATSLNPLRQSRVIQNKSTGERKQQVSVDGGKTWQ